MHLRNPDPILFCSVLPEITSTPYFSTKLATFHSYTRTSWIFWNSWNGRVHGDAEHMHQGELNASSDTTGSSSTRLSGYYDNDGVPFKFKAGWVIRRRARLRHKSSVSNALVTWHPCTMYLSLPGLTLHRTPQCDTLESSCGSTDSIHPTSLCTSIGCYPVHRHIANTKSFLEIVKPKGIQCLGLTWQKKRKLQVHSYAREFGIFVTVTYLSPRLNHANYHCLV